MGTMSHDQRALNDLALAAVRIISDLLSFGFQSTYDKVQLSRDTCNTRKRGGSGAALCAGKDLVVPVGAVVLAKFKAFLLVLIWFLRLFLSFLSSFLSLSLCCLLVSLSGGNGFA